MKKIFALMLTIALAVSCMSIPAWATETEPFQMAETAEETVIETETEPETVVEAATETVFETESETAAETDPDTEAGIEPETAAESEAVAETEAETETVAETKSETEVEAETEAPAEALPEAEEAVLFKANSGPLLASNSVSLYTTKSQYIKCSAAPKSTVAKDPTIVYVKVLKDGDGDDAVWVKGRKEGQTVVNVTGPDGTVSTLTVKVTQPKLENVASRYNIVTAKTYKVNVTGSCIWKAESANENVVTVTKTGMKQVQLSPKGPGTTTVTLRNVYGYVKTFTVYVDKVYFKNLLAAKTTANKLVYYATRLTGNSVPGATVTTTIGQKTYKATVNDKGTYSLPVPIQKIGTEFNLTYAFKGQSISRTIKVVKCASYVRMLDYTFKDTTTVRVHAKNVHKGDKLYVIISTTTYVRTITENASEITVNFDIKAPGRYGIRMAAALNNKYGQRLATEKDYVYRGTDVFIGDTKEDVRWVPLFNDPAYIEELSDGERWVYQFVVDDVSYYGELIFDKNGVVVDGKDLDVSSNM